MIRVEARETIDRPTAEVFDYVADLRNEKDWNPDLVSIEKTSEGPVGPGTTFVGTYKGMGKLKVEIAEYERPSVLRFHATGSRMTLDVNVRLKAENGTTVGRLIVAIEPHGLTRILAPLMGGSLKRQLGARPRQLRQALDGASAAASAPQPAA